VPPRPRETGITARNPRFPYDLEVIAAFELRTGLALDKGPVRESNQDSARIDAETGAMVVADGLGGHSGGEVASAVAADAFMEVLRSPEPAIPSARDLLPERHFAVVAGSGRLADADAALRERFSNLDVPEIRLRLAFLAGHAAVTREARRRPALRDMGTTLVGAWLHGTRVHHIHAGDSRLYLLRDRVVRCLTRDHTVLALLAERGLVEPGADHSQHPMRNRLTQALGGTEAPSPDLNGFPAAPGDRLLLCSDGVWSALDQAVLSGLLSRFDDPERAADALVSTAIAHGSTDNCAAVVVDLMQ
jgi:serine/threonine protein phosphatase PrpC